MYQIRLAKNPADYAAGREAFVDYLAFLNNDLTYQNIDAELDDLAGIYHAPIGALLLARAPDGQVAGVVGLRYLEEGIAEMKRLYVYPDHQGQGLGQQLVLALLETARAFGYHYVRLDTVTRLAAANRLYAAMGFYLIEPYCHNPFEGAVFMEYAL